MNVLEELIAMISLCGSFSFSFFFFLKKEILIFTLDNIKYHTIVNVPVLYR